MLSFSSLKRTNSVYIFKVSCIFYKEYLEPKLAHSHLERQQSVVSALDAVKKIIISM